MAQPARARARGNRAADRAPLTARLERALKADEQTQLYRSLLKTIRQLEVVQQIPPHRLCLSCTHLEASKNPKKTPHHCNLLNIDMGDTDLRLDCSVYEEGDLAKQKKNWKIFAQVA